jgi:WD40 repeat protein
VLGAALGRPGGEPGGPAGRAVARPQRGALRPGGAVIWGSGCGAMHEGDSVAVDDGGPRAGAQGAGEQQGAPADAGEQPRPAADAGGTGEQAAAATAAAEPDRIATQHDFGRELTQARQQAGRTVREVARAAGIPPSTAGDYFAGRHLPPATQPELLGRILRACGETDPARQAAWADALARIRRGPGRRPASRPPYLGLASFQPEDEARFFGREELTRRLASMVAGAGSPGAAAGVPLAVVGPSGSGKSSLLRAGLIPALRGRSSPRLALFTPGRTPLAGLARQLARLGTGPGQPAREDAIEAALQADPASAAILLGPAGPASPPPGTTPGGAPGPADGQPVLVVDQFEEVFTECPGEADRQRFITAVCALAGPAVVAIALRADFYDHALRYPELTRALQERQLVVGPMTAEEVRRAIVEPARLARVSVDDGLVEVLLRDLAPHGRTGPAAAGPAAAHEPGALPLLSHALLTTWNNSHGGRLTVAHYQAGGGIQHAIARTADEVYRSLDEPGRDIARRLFLRLVRVTDDAPEARTTVPLRELREWAATSSSDVLDQFVTARLITVDSGSAQISHEALLTAWPLLRAWIDDNRDGLREQRRISEATRAWDEAGRDHAALLRGGQLALARDWAADPVNRETLSPLARTFVDTSIVGQELHEAAERNRTRRLHRLVASLTALVVVTIMLAGYAFGQRQAASTARSRATTAAAIAQSREVAVEASQVRVQDPALAAQLSVAAYRIAATADARASLLESSGTPDAAALIDSAGPVQAVSLSPDHRVLAVAAADGTLRLWDVARPGHPARLGAPLLPKSKEPLYTVAFSADGTLLAAAGADRKVWLWQVSHPGRAVRLADPLTGPASTIYSVAFSPRGAVLAAGSADDTVRLWNVASPAHPVPLGGPLTGPAGFVQSVAFSPDGRTLAAGSADDTVRLWNVADPGRPAALGKPLTGPAAMVTSVAFSPGGGLLAAGSQDDKVWLWDVRSPQRPVPAGALAGAADWVNTVSFSPDGRSLAAGSSDSQVRVWDLASRALTADLPHPQPITSLAWDGAGRLVSGDADGEARIWALPSPVLRAGGPVNSVAFAPRGALLAVGGATLQVWDARRRTELSAAAPPAGAGIVNAVGFAPGGTMLAAGYGDGQMQLWRVSAAGRLAPLSQPARAEQRGSDLVEYAAFSPDGRLLATCGDDGAIRLWSVTDPARPRLVATVPDSGTYVFSVAFRRDGTVLAAASADGLARLWDIGSPAHPTPLGGPLGGLASTAYSVAFSPDGRTLAVGSADKTVHLWNVTDPARPVPLGPPLTGPGGYVYSVQFSPDGRLLGTGVTDGTVWLWRVADPARPSLLATLTGPGGNVYSVSFSPDGRAIAAGSADTTVRLWDTGAAAAASAVCGTAGQPLTAAEWRAYLPGRRYAAPCPGR